MLFVALALLGCGEPPNAGSATKGEAGPSSPKQAGDTDHERFTGKGVVDLAALIHKKPDEVEAVLGKPTDTGKQRISCVRFVPERVFFACEQEARFYAHPELERIVVEYEDGIAAVVSLVGLRGEGEFTPDKALALAGLALPGNPRESKPEFGLGDDPGQQVQAWDWFNASARMRVAGQQFRVRVSVVNGEWKRSKVELINNSPLSPDQKQRIKTSKADAAEGVSEDPNLGKAPAPIPAPAPAAP